MGTGADEALVLGQGLADRFLPQRLEGRSLLPSPARYARNGPESVAGGLPILGRNRGTRPVQLIPGRCSPAAAEAYGVAAREARGSAPRKLRSLLFAKNEYSVQHLIPPGRLKA